MRTSAFTHDFLLLFAGPLIWALHFLVIYGFTGILCARSGGAVSWLGIELATWGIAAAGLAAILAIAACFSLRPRSNAEDNRGFVRGVSSGLALLASIAIAWETAAVFLVPPCA